MLFKQYLDYRIFLWIATAVFLYLIMDIPVIDPIWNLFSDANEYREQSQRDLFSLDFFAPQEWLHPRPFTMPLIYKIAGSDPYNMVRMQKFIYCICVFVFAFSFLAYIKNAIVKVISFYTLLFFFTWWNIVGWSDNILSESISISLMLLWFAIILYYYRKQNRIGILLLIPATILLSFTRDTWPYIILLFFILNVALFFKKNRFKSALLLSGFAILLFFTQSYTAERGIRTRLPVFNSIAGRIVQSEKYLDWWVKKGMPQSGQLVKDFKGAKVDAGGRPMIYARYIDSTYTELFIWINARGKSLYQQFVLTHPSYFFLAGEDKKDIERIFCYSSNDYFKKPQGFFANAHNVFPVFGLWSTLILVTISSFLWYKRRRIIYGFPLILFILVAANALLSYNADTMEVNRHLFITGIMAELISLLVIFLCADYIIRGAKAGKRSRNLL
jgi:hypothetical protein